MDEELAASVTLIGRVESVPEAAEKEGVDLGGIRIVCSNADSRLGAYARVYHDMRKGKGMTEAQAKAEISNPLKWGAMMVRSGEADAMVAGAENSTADVLRAGISIVGALPGIRTVSSCFVLCGLDPKWGNNGSFIFSDCAVVPNPTPEQLADIAQSAAQSCREMLGIEPVVALTSFSTKGSACHPDVKKVQETVALLRARKPDFEFDGELQADAALVPEVTDLKAPGSPVRGRVNTIVFPDLDSGNIGYKLVQRLAGAQAFGPFLQGFSKPISDLSRGASVGDIVTTCAVTLAQVK